MKHILIAVLACTAIILAGCYTYDTTDETTNSATLHSQIWCHGPSNGYVFHEVNGGGGFISVGPWRRFDCTGTSGANDFSIGIGNLAQGATYQHRLGVRLDDGRTGWYDSDGTSQGTNYTTFHTNVDQSEWSGNVAADSAAGASIAVKACFKSFIVQAEYVNNTIPYAKGIMDCNTAKPKIATYCKTRVRDNKSTGTSLAENSGPQYCRATAIPYGMGDTKVQLDGVTIEMTAVLSDRDHHWTNPTRLCPIIDHLDDGRSRMICHAKWYNYAPAYSILENK